MSIEKTYKEYCVSTAEQKKIMDVMNYFRDQVSNGNKVNLASFEDAIMNVLEGFKRLCCVIQALIIIFANILLRTIKRKNVGKRCIKNSMDNQNNVKRWNVYIFLE